MRDVTSQPHGQSAPVQCVLAARRHSSRQLWDGRRLHQKTAAAVDRQHPNHQQHEPPPAGAAGCGEAGGGGAHVGPGCAYRTTCAIETVWDQLSRKLFSAAALCPLPPRGTADGACPVVGRGPPPRPASAGALRRPCWILLIPPELLTEIFSHMDVRSLFSFSATCRYVYGTLHSTPQNWQRCDFTGLAGLVDSKLEAFLVLADAPWRVPNPHEELKEGAERGGDLDPDFDDAEGRPEAAAEKEDEGRSSVERCRARTNVWRPGWPQHPRSSSLPTPIPLRQAVFAAALRSVTVDSTLVTHHILALVLPRLPSLEHLSARRCPRIDIMRLAVAALVLVLDQEKWWLPRLGRTPEDGETEGAGADAAVCRRQTRTRFKQLKLKSLWIRGAGTASGSASAETQDDGDADPDESAAAAAGAAAADGEDQGNEVAYESSARRRFRGTAALAGPARFGSRRGVGEAGAIPRPGEVSALRALTRALSALTSPERPVHIDLSVCSTCREAVSVIGDGELCVRCALPIVQHGFGGVCEQCCQVRRRCRACQRIVLCEGCCSSRAEKEGAPRPFRRKSRAADDDDDDDDDRSPGAEPTPAVACCSGWQGF